MTGPLESTNELYAIAKIAGIKWCESYNRQYRVDYRSVMPTNRDGIGDNYRLQKSHVIPVLIRRLHEAIINGASVVSLRGMGNMKSRQSHIPGSYLSNAELAQAKILPLRSCADHRKGPRL
ncbi:MAG: NAD-dependent epimerase/dehydratase family protein [Chlorobiaceae bacterium]